MSADKPQRRDRQRPDPLGAFPRRDDKRGPRRKPGQGVRGASGVRHCRAGRDADRLQARDHVGEHGVLAAVKMTGAGRVDDEAVRIVGGDDRRIAQRPDGETFERFAHRPLDPRDGSQAPSPAPAPWWPAFRCAGRPSTRPRWPRTPRAVVPSGRPAPAASPHQARTRPSCAEADRSAKSAGKARRPWTSHASTTKSALSPARHRINSSSHRARPTPGTGSGVEGSVDTRHLVADAVGCPKSAASVCRRQRRTAIAIDPEASAASDSRRDDVIESRATSATTAPSPP